MIEILEIIFFLIIFSSILLVPINIFTNSRIGDGFTLFDKSTLNLALNLNLLLFLSFFTISVYSLKPLLIVSYIFLIIFLYRKQLTNIKNFFYSLVPFFLIFFVLSIDISHEPVLGWDAKFVYYIKSLFFFEQKNISDLNQFAENHWHPHFGSYLWGFFWSFSITKLEYFGRLFYLFLFCYSFFYVSKISKNDLVNNVIFLFLIFIFYEYEYFSGLQETLIFSILILISRYFYLNITTNNLNYFALILMFSNLFIWIKSEGIIYFLASIILLLLISEVSKKIKFYAILVCLIFYSIKLTIYEIYDFDVLGQKEIYSLEYIASLDFNTIFNKLVRLFVWFIYYISNNLFFCLFLLILFYEKIFVKDEKLNQYNYLLIIYLLFIIIFLLFAYTLRDQEITYAIRTTMDRLLMTISGFFVYPIILKLFYYLNLDRIK